MATIATTSNTTPFEYQTTLMDRSHLDGNLYAMVKGSTANTYDLYISTNNGTSWTLHLSVTRTNVSEIGAIFVLDPRYNQLAWVYRTNESSEDRIYFRAIDNLSAPAWSSEVLVTASPNSGVAGSTFTGMDVKVFVVPSVMVYAVVVTGTTYASMQGSTLYALTGTTLSSMAANLTVLSGTREWKVTGSGRSTPSLEVEHNGDGKTASANTPNLWLVLGRAYLGLVKIAWNGAGWTGPSSMITIRSDLGADDSVCGRYDGSRLLMAVPNPSSTSTVVIHERNKANTATTVRTTPTHTTGVVRHCTVSYNSVNGDIRVYAVGTSTTVLYYVDYVRATGLWGAWTAVLATAVLGAAGNNYGVRRGSYGNARHDVYTAHAASSTLHTSQILAYTPYTPTWNTSASVYANGGAADVNTTLVLDWDFLDPDPSDVQASYVLQRQIGAGALQHYTAAGGTWGTPEVFNTTGTTSVTLASSWAAGSDANYTYKVKTRDSTGLDSPFSAALVLIPSVKVNPAITAPTAAQVLTTGSVTFTWTASEETAYRVTLATNPGAVVMFDSGWVTGTALTYSPAYVLANGSGWTGTVQTRNNEGLASTIQSVNFTVSYTVPATPTLVNTAVPASGWVSVVITNPTPAGAQPALINQELYRRIGTDDATIVRLATGLASGATFLDWKAAAATDYRYRVQAFGVNGTAVYSAWTT